MSAFLAGCSTPESIYKSLEGEAEIRALYNEALAGLGLGYESLTVGTRLGDTHLLALGPEGVPPVVFLPGGNALNPTCLKWFLPLAERHRLYAPDIVGQPGLSAQTRPSSKGTGMPSGRRTSSTAWSVRRSWASPTGRP